MEKLDLQPFIGCDSLPTLPDQISRVLDETSRASAMDYNIVQIIQFDPAIASRVLQVSNSALYGYPSQIGSLQQAAGLLGPGVIKSIILTTPIFEDLREMRRFIVLELITIDSGGTVLLSVR